MAGDGGYGSLIHYLYGKEKEVIIYSVKGSTKPELTALANNHEWIEDIIEIKDKENFNTQFVQKTTLLPEWKAIVVKAKYFDKLPFLDVNFFAKQILQSSNSYEPLKPFDTIEKCKNLIAECCNAGIFIPGTRTTKTGAISKTIEINKSHILLKGL
ncbi:MAG TPA: hypothetical protein GXZ26_10605 [Firmicutes bacterium]|nr:hypothetical protein [Bacillota bacterium]